LDTYLTGSDGRTPTHRLKGRSFKQEAAQFGECVWYPVPKSGTSKAEQQMEIMDMFWNERRKWGNAYRDENRKYQGKGY